MINAPHSRYRDQERQVHDNTEGHVGDARDKHLAIGGLLVAVVPLVGTGDILLRLFGQLEDTVILAKGILLGPGLRRLLPARLERRQVHQRGAQTTAGVTTGRKQCPLLGSVALGCCHLCQLGEICGVGESGLVNILVALDTSDETPCSTCQDKHEWN